MPVWAHGCVKPGLFLHNVQNILQLICPPPKKSMTNHCKFCLYPEKKHFVSQKNHFGPLYLKKKTFAPQKKRIPFWRGLRFPSQVAEAVCLLDREGRLPRAPDQEDWPGCAARLEQ